MIRRLVSVVLLTAAVTGLAALGLGNEVFAGFQRRATDNLLPAAANSTKVVVVGIDRKSIQTHGVLPWPRTLMAQLVDHLSADGAAVIAFDITFSTERDGDPELAAAIRAAGNVILGEQIAKSKSGGPGRPLLIVAAGGLDPKLAAAPPSLVGHVQVTPDAADGVVRTVPLVYDSPDGFFPSLSLAAVMRYRGFGGPIIVRPNGVQIGGRFVPTNSSKSMIINFAAKLSEPANAVSAADVLDDTVNPKKLAGKIVFIGATDATSTDRLPAPIAKAELFPGVFLHANASNTMLTGGYIEPVSNDQTLLWVALLTFVIGLFVVTFPLWLSPVLALALGAGYFVFAMQRFNQGSALNFVYPSLAVVLAFIGGLAARYFGETRQRRRVTALFSQYVPETVAQRLVDEDRASSAAEGERLDMTVLFCDLRGFTALSEQLSPATVRIMLNHYYDRVTELVLGLNGTLMKYVGDEVFAVWGAPLPSDDHPARALECAIAIQELTPQLNRELLEQGAPEVSFGIGLNTGEAVAAHFGGGRRRQYDVVGDTVNVGARCCSIAARGQVILTDEVLRRVPSPPAVEAVGPVELKGVSRELRLWAVVRDSDSVVDGGGHIEGASSGAGGTAADAAR